MKKYRNFLLGLLFFSLVIIVVWVSLAQFPEWGDSIPSILTLIGLSFLGVLGSYDLFQRVMNGFKKIFTEKSDNNEPPPKDFGPRVIFEAGNDSTNIVTQIEKLDVGGDFIIENPQSNISKFKSSLKKIFNIPALPDYFVRRDILLEELEIILKEELQDIALVGAGGTGKSIFSKSVSSSSIVETCFGENVFWLPIGPNILSENNVEDYINRLLFGLGHPINPTANLQIKMLLLAESFQSEKALLILDDVWSSEVYSVFRKNLDVNRFNILITTRNRDLPIRNNIKSIINVGALSRDEAKSLVIYRVGKSNFDASAEKVIKNLGFHPLGVSLAAAQIMVGDISWDDIIRAIDDNDAISMLDFDDPNRREESLKITFQLSLDSLSENDKSRLLSMSIFASGEKFGIDEITNIFPDIRDKYPQKFPSDVPNAPITDEMKLDINSTLSLLYRKSLIELEFVNGDPLVKIHPIIQMLLLQKLMSSSYYSDVVEQYIIHCGLVILSTNLNPRLIENQYNPEVHWEHLLEMLWKKLSDPNNKLPVSDENAKLSFNHMVGQLTLYWRNFGSKEKIIKWGNRNLIRLQNEDEVDSSYVQDLLREIHKAYLYNGDNDEAKKILKKIEKQFDITIDSFDSELELALIKALQSIHEKNYDQAIELYELALGKALKNEKYNYQLGLIYGNLSIIYLAKKEYDKAIKYINLAIVLAEELNDMIAYGQRVGNLGAVYQAIGFEHLENAEIQLEKSYRILKRTKNRESFGKKAWNLGNLNFALGRPKLARAYLNQALNTLGEISHPEVTQIQKAIDVYDGAIDSRPVFLDVTVLSSLAHDAMLGDIVAKEKILPTLKFMTSANIENEISIYAKNLLELITQGSYDELEVSNLPEELKYNIAALERVTKDKNLPDFANAIGNLIIGLFLDEKEASQAALQIIKGYSSGRIKDNYMSEELLIAIQKLLDGEKNLEIILSSITDDFFIYTIRNAINSVSNSS